MSFDAFGSAKLFTLTNKHGLIARVMDYGATLVSLETPDRQGNCAEVTLGFDRFEDYLSKSPYFGCTVGRVGNRIGAGKFNLEGKAYQLALNDGPNNLHGGKVGFDKKTWEVISATSSSVEFKLVSPDGDEGFPGELHVWVRYTLTNNNGLKIDYRAFAKQTTIQNLTNHTYFNLGSSDDILDHRIQIASDFITPVSSSLIPTGELLAVKGTPFNLRKLTRIGNGIDADHEQIGFGGGYDHNFALSKNRTGLRKVATVYEPASGRKMEVLTTEPGIQFYSGNFLAGPLEVRGGKTVGKRGGLCLETQHYPDAINQPNFASIVLGAGKTYLSTTEYRFSS